MVMAKQAVIELMRHALANAQSGKFNWLMLLVCTGFLGNIEKGFQSVPEMEKSMSSMSGSISDLNLKMASIVERNDGHQKILDLHTRILEAMEKRLQRIETNTKEKP